MTMMLETNDRSTMHQQPTENVGVCSECHEVRELPAKGKCNTCYIRLRRQAKTGVCPGCHRMKQLPIRGMCGRCASTTRTDHRPEGTDARRRGEFSEVERQAAEDHREIFDQRILPVVQRYARWRLSSWRPGQRDDAMQEIAGLAWLETIKAAVKGQHRVVGLAQCIAEEAFAAFCAGRRVTGCESASDVLSDRARRQRRATVLSFTSAKREGDEYSVDALLRDSRCRSIPDLVALLIDFKEWRASLNDLRTRFVNFMALGNTVEEAMREFSLQRFQADSIRRQLRKKWAHFQGDVIANADS